MLRTSELEYELPEELIAMLPASRRDAARLLVTGRAAGAAVLHRSVRGLPEFLRAGDLLVFNTTRVIPARLVGVRRDTGGRVEGLFLGEAVQTQGAGSERLRWRVLLRAKRLRPGCVVDLEESSRGTEEVEGVGAGGTPALLDQVVDGIGAMLVLEAEGQDGPGSWIARVDEPRGVETVTVLERIGRTPLPPYILGARKRAGLEVSDADDRTRYQTVYASTEKGASVAAPTAGLHFTPELLGELARMGVGRADVTLHVGTGTFKPVETETVEEHPMHAEWCRAGVAAMESIRATRASGGRVIAVGTTAARAIESLAEHTPVQAAEGVWTRLLVTPGYRWRLVDGLLTNFHLPRSTLMALVGALLEGGVARLKEIYAKAVEEEYRFYSYGDAMLVVP